MQREHIPGLSLAVVKDGRVVRARGYGLANVELNVPARVDSVYEIGSMTKQFTATAIMMLVEDGKLSLDGKLTNYLSGLPPAWNEVTLRQLLTHSSGIKGYLSVPNVMERTTSSFSLSNLLSLLAPYPLEFTPGAKHAYSNTGYFLLGNIIEAVSHQSYADFLEQRIFEPLDMNATRFNDVHTVLTNRASGYSWRDGRLQRADYMDPSWAFSAGGLVSSVADMAKWDAALSDGKLLSPADRQQMWTRARLNDGSTCDYGFGWYVFDYKAGHRLLAHAGGIPGFVCCISRWVDDRLTVIVMLNSEGGRDSLEYLMTQAIARRYVPSLADQPIADAEPQVTAGMKATLMAAIAGKIDPALFENDFRTEFFPARAAQFHAELANLGPMKAFVLLSKTDAGHSRAYRYRGVFRDDAVLFDVTVNKQGQFSAFGVEIE
jgi:CubicO group peptidase (beta-lactamase class C family)